MHGSLECAEKNTASKRHLSRSIQAVMGCKGGFVLVSVIAPHLPIPADSILGGETVGSLKESIHLSIRGWEYKSLWVKAFSLLYLTMNRNALFVFMANTFGAAHSKVGGLMTSWSRIRSIRTLQKSQVSVLPIWCGINRYWSRHQINMIFCHNYFS